MRAGRRRSTDAQLAQVLALHEAVVVAIVRGDGVAASEAMAQHFDTIAMSLGEPMQD
jgi:DNA-binding FadR family transcriptional regulator